MWRIGIFGFLLIVFVVFLCWFFPDFWPAIKGSLGSGEWWASGILNWFIFGLAIAVFTKISEWISNYPYRKYRVVTRCSQHNNCTKTYKLSHSDARAILTNDFEGWQQLKSIISPTYWITTPFYEDAIDAKWLKIDEREKEINIYWDKLNKSEQFDPERSKPIECGL